MKLNILPIKLWVLLVPVFFVILSCSNKSSSTNDCTSVTAEDDYLRPTNSDIVQDYDDNDYSSNYEYNYKSGGQYNYDVSGYDEDGNYVYGNVDIDECGGSGYIEDAYGEEKYINVNWSGYGEIDAYDEDGIYYDLQVD